MVQEHVATEFLLLKKTFRRSKCKNETEAQNGKPPNRDVYPSTESQLMMLKIDFSDEEHPICCYFCYEVAGLCALYHMFSSSYHKSRNIIWVGT